MKDFFRKHKIETVSVTVFIVLMLFACIYNFGMPEKKTTQKHSSEITENAVQTKNNETDGEANVDTCSLSVDCSTILNNIEELKSDKKILVPKDGIIFSVDRTEFEDGETAFELLLRELNKNNISIEYKELPFPSGCYIENIGGIGEFDCGQTSGWLYKVNDEMPNAAASEYVLKNGDKVEFVYSCKIGDI